MMEFKISLNLCLLVLSLIIGSVIGQSVIKDISQNGRDDPLVSKLVLGSTNIRIPEPKMLALEEVKSWMVEPYAAYNSSTELLYAMDSNLTSYAVAAVDAAWIYNTDITDENAAAMNEASAAFSSMYYYWWVTTLNPYDYSTVEDPYEKRQFELQQSIGTAILNSTDYEALSNLINSMTEKLNNRVCPYIKQNCDLTTEGLTIDNLEVLMGVAKDYDELLYYWVQWRDASGKLMLGDFPPYVDLTNEAAVGNEFSDGGQMWLDPYTGTNYTSDDFKAEVESIWQQLEPFYVTLHAYVRHKLMQNPNYSSHFHEDGLIPAHILGNMYAQSWVNIYDYVAPYPEVPLIDLTPVLESSISNVTQMFEIAEDFFTSLGMYQMTQDFWSNTLYEQPLGRDVVCHASAWDFFSTEQNNEQDGRFRIKMCTDKNQEDFITIHHEMGHIEYFMAYSNGKPLIYRDGANPGFHEAIGDTIALSVTTPSHLQMISDILNSSSSALDDRRNIEGRAIEQDLNFLMKQALDKVTFLPFAYIIDLWRWDAFAGTFQNDTYNSEWWKRRVSYQGLKPPVTRNNEDFDIGCKFHVPSNVPYIRYFVAAILQFQFHERLCELAGNVGPIYNCDIYNSTDAGAALLSLLENGNSLQWQTQLADFLGVPEGKMDASAILNYFDPLIEYLDTYIADNNITIGWLNDPEIKNIPVIDAEIAIKKMDTNLTFYVQDYVEATWNYYTDENDDNLVAMDEASALFNSMYNWWWHDTIEPYDNNTTLKVPYVERQYELQQSIGTAILDENDLADFNTHVNNMMSQLNNKIEGPPGTTDCEGGCGIDELETLMGTEREYSNLLWYWEHWRSVSGKNMFDDYPPYVSLLNKAAVNNSFLDASEMWINPYTSTALNYSSVQFRDEIDSLMDDISEFYEMLHAYVRSKLKKNTDYGKYFNGDNDKIPAHILGNMYAQSWENIYDIVAPFPEIPLINLTEALVNTDTKPFEMFKIAEEFFTSLGMYKMTNDFWTNSMLEDPINKTVVCHASAMDFRSTEVDNTVNGTFRIKMCTNVNQDDFITIHHEMGHIEYFMAYSNGKPLIYRDGANPGFHEAIGDTIALSVSTPEHLKMVQDYLNHTSTEKAWQSSAPKEDYDNSTKQDLNFLMKQALTKVAFLPFAYIVDSWRWEAFEGLFGSETYNTNWWKKRIEYQGIMPPIKRTADTDFDIGCKYHVPANVPYIRYFVATILQFQFHERLCEVAGNVGPIYKCDIYNNKKAGGALLKMLHHGNSMQWQDQLAEFLNAEGKMDASALLNYFQPLIQFLNDTIIAEDIPVGWVKNDVNDFISAGDEISAIVPIIVGAVLAVLVVIVVIAFFLGQKRRKEAEKKNELKMEAEKKATSAAGKVNEALELNEKLDI